MAVLGVQCLILPTPDGGTSSEWVKNKRLVSLNLAGTDASMKIRRRGAGSWEEYFLAVRNTIAP